MFFLAFKISSLSLSKIIINNITIGSKKKINEQEENQIWKGSSQI